MGIFCNNICNDKCKIILEEIKNNLLKNKNSEPSVDALACLDTCPIICNCQK